MSMENCAIPVETGPLKMPWKAPWEVLSACHRYRRHATQED